MLNNLILALILTIRLAAARYARNHRAREATWLYFSKQKDAFTYVDNVSLLRKTTERDSKEMLQVFAVENGEGGVRKFIAATYSDFWAKYCLLHPHSRNYYEIIRESKPCRLYFDIEFNTELNPHVIGEDLMKIFKPRLQKQVASKLGVVLPCEGILDLDSTTPTKFSRHLICHMGAVFKNTSHMKNFVDELIADLKTERMENDSIKKLFVRTAVGKESVFIDSGVYSRNRCFRMLFSSKRKKSSSLRPSPSNQFQIPSPPSIGVSEDLFYASLIGYVEFSPIREPRRACTDREKTFRRILKRDISPIPSLYPSLYRALSPDYSIVCGTRNILLLTYGESSYETDKRSFRGLALSSCVRAGSHYSDKCHASTSARYRGGGNKLGNKFPLVDEYVIKEAQKKNPKAFLKSKHIIDGNYECGKKTLLCYSIGGSRYCGNIGREHKSNGIYYVAVIPDGMIYQKCHDPDCNHYRSPPVQTIPLIAMDEDLELEDLSREIDMEFDTCKDPVLKSALGLG
ncbi:hypothetical protein AAMO2058_001135600 [Amorphochlora amoebiformis]